MSLNKKSSGRVLVVGSDCLIGKILASRLKRAGWQVIGTTRRRDLINESTLYLDLAENLASWTCPQNIDVAILCAGVSKLEVCRSDPKATFQVNVKGVCSLTRKLAGNGVFIIYPSTSHVFDGSVPWQKSDAPPSPMTEYGKQKAETERLMLEFGDSVAIIRSAKILGPGQPLFVAWAEALKKGEVIHPFSDMTFAPIPLSCAVSVIQLVADLRLSGILQISGECDISYENAARLGAEVLGASEDQIRPLSVAESGMVSEPIPIHTTLDIDRLKSVLGIVPPDVHWTVRKAFFNLLESVGECI